MKEFFLPLEILSSKINSFIPSWEDFPGGPVAETPCTNAGGLGSIPGQGTRSHMLQLRIPNATTKT